MIEVSDDAFQFLLSEPGAFSTILGAIQSRIGLALSSRHLFSSSRKVIPNCKKSSLAVYFQIRSHRTDLPPIQIAVFPPSRAFCGGRQRSDSGVTNKQANNAVLRTCCSYLRRDRDLQKAESTASEHEPPRLDVLPSQTMTPKMIATVLQLFFVVGYDKLITPLAGDITRQTCSLNFHSQTHTIRLCDFWRSIHEDHR